MNRFFFVFAAGLALAAFAAGLYLAVTAHGGGAPAITGFLWPEPPRLSTFELDRDDGTKLTEQDFRGRWTLVFFGFANCPDVCPTTMNTLARVVEKLQSDSALAAALQVAVPCRGDCNVLEQWLRDCCLVFNLRTTNGGRRTWAMRTAASARPCVD